MPEPRETPYSAFNFRVNLNSEGVQDDTAFGGFSDVSGLGVEITLAEYRNGNERENHVRKVPGIHKVSDVTLKRGIINGTDFKAWIDDTRRSGTAAKRNVVIKLFDETGTAEVQSWRLLGVVPSKYTGPTLAAKGGGDVAMEELTLSADAIEVEIGPGG